MLERSVDLNSVNCLSVCRKLRCCFLYLLFRLPHKCWNHYFHSKLLYKFMSLLLSLYFRISVFRSCHDTTPLFSASDTSVSFPMYIPHLFGVNMTAPDKFEIMHTKEKRYIYAHQLETNVTHVHRTASIWVKFIQHYDLPAYIVTHFSRIFDESGTPIIDIASQKGKVHVRRMRGVEFNW